MMRGVFGSEDGWPGLLERFARRPAARADVQAIAMRHARPEHVEDALAFMHRVRAAVGEPPGLIEFTTWRDGPSTRLIGHSRWASEADFRAALPLITSLAPERREEWSERPDDVLLLEEA